MESVRVFLVILLALAFTEAQKPPAKSPFPDFLAPFRGLFKSKQPQIPHYAPHSQKFHPSLKDSTVSETSKYPGQVQNPEENDQGFRPIFPTGFDDSSTSLGGEYSSTSSRPSPYTSDPHYRIHPASSNRVPRQEFGGNQGFTNDFQPFGNYGDEQQQLQHQPESSPGFTDFGQYGSPDFGQNYEQPRRPHSRPPRRPTAGDSGPQESQGFAPGPHGHSHGHGRPPPHRRRPSYRAGPQSNPDFETQVQGPQYRPYQPSSSPTMNYPLNNYVEQPSYGHGHGSRGPPGETPIITIDDVQNEHSLPGARAPYFDDVYHQPSPHMGSGPGPSSAHIQPIAIPAFTTLPQSAHSTQGPIYQSQPLQTPPGPGRYRQFNPNSNSGASDEMYQETKSKKLFAPRPPRGRPAPMSSSTANPGLGSSTQQSQPEVLYGRPHMMMSSSTPPAIVQAPRKIRPFKKFSDKPILLSSPKIPNFMNSASVSNPVVQVYEPHAAASGHGHGGGHGDFEGIQSNGDRILYHVAGHQGPYSYRFGYDTGKGYNRLFRFEEKDGQGYVKGKYGFYDKHGKMIVTNYEAHPQSGFSAQRGH